MKVVKILGVVFGALFLLTGIALLAGSAIFGAGQGKFDQQLAEQGLAGPVTGTVTAIDPPVYTVEYTDKAGAAQTGSGQVAEGTTPPEQGDDVQVYYSTARPQPDHHPRLPRRQLRRRRRAAADHRLSSAWRSAR